MREKAGTDFERGDKNIICIKISDDLKPTAKRYDLSLDMFLQDSAMRRSQLHLLAVTNLKDGRQTHPINRMPTS